MKHLIALLLITFLVAPAFAGPRVTVVHGENPSNLEKQAIALLTEQLQNLFDAEVQTATKVSSQAENVILLGRPETNSALKSALGDRWPKLGDQGHAIKTLADQPPTLLLGGGSDLATYWAVAELGNHLGVRYLLVGDVYPPIRPTFSLTGLNQTAEPLIATRTWWPNLITHFDTGFWPLRDQERVQRQLQKLKFNGLRIPVELKTATETSADSVPAVFRSIRIASDAPGRRAFGSDLQFQNPDVVTARGVSAVGTFLMAVEDAGLTVGLGLQSTKPLNNQTVLRLSERSLGAFPQVQLRRASKQLEAVTSPTSIVVNSQAAGDIESSLYYLARRAWDPGMTPEKAIHDLYTPIAGRDDVADRMQLAFDLLEQTDDKLAKLLADHKLSCEPGPNMLTQFLTVEADLERGFKEVLDGYIKSTNEFLRAHGNAAGPTRPLFFYYTKRGEFAIHLTTCHIALSAAAKARKAKQTDAELEQVEKAVESLYNGLNSLSEVARDQSDRGVIAVLNEWGYKPLNKELERLTEGQ